MQGPSEEPETTEPTERRGSVWPDDDEKVLSGAQRCHAHSRHSGERCKNAAVLGAKVCRMHGGSAPQVRNAAKLRLAELATPAIATLAREMARAESSSDRQRAANSILDRAGYSRVARIETADAADMLRRALEDMTAEGVIDPEPFDVIDSDDDDD